jgi:hypothetical protein
VQIAVEGPARACPRCGAAAHLRALRPRGFGRAAGAARAPASGLALVDEHVQVHGGRGGDDRSDGEEGSLRHRAPGGTRERRRPAPAARRLRRVWPRSARWRRPPPRRGVRCATDSSPAHPPQVLVGTSPRVDHRSRGAVGHRHAYFVTGPPDQPGTLVPVTRQVEPTGVAVIEPCSTGSPRPSSPAACGPPSPSGTDCATPHPPRTARPASM